MANKTVYRYVITSKSKEAYLASTKREAEAWTKKNGGTFRKAKASDRDKFPGYNIVVPSSASRAKPPKSPKPRFERFKAEQKGTDAAIKLTGGRRAQSQGKKPKWPSKGKIVAVAQFPILHVNMRGRGGRTIVPKDYHPQYFFAAMESAAFLANMWARAGTERQKEMVKDAGAQASAALKREYPWYERYWRVGISRAARGDDWRKFFSAY